MKTIIPTILVAVAGFAWAEPLAKEEKKEFSVFYRTWIKLLEEFPDKPEVKVLFFDLDHDGNEDAIASSYGQRHEDGSTQSVFQRKGRSWVAAKRKMSQDGTISLGSSLFARDDEFYSASIAGGPPDLVVIHKNYDKLVAGGMAPPAISKVSINKEGFLIVEPLPSLDQFIAYSSKFQKLERLEIESYTD